MIVNKNKRSNNLGQNKVGGEVSMYSMDHKNKINLYQEHPKNIISLSEFNQIALHRLQALRKIEWMTDASQGDKINVEVNKYLHEHGLAYEGRYITNTQGLSILNPPTMENFRKFYQNDNISHFICRLAYCRNEELRKWLLQQETRLFNMRVQEINKEVLLDLIKENFNLSYD